MNRWAIRSWGAGLAGAAALLCSTALQAEISGEADTSLNGSGFKLLEYRTPSRADVETRNWNNNIIGAAVHADGSVLILGVSSNLVRMGDESFGWDEDHQVAIIARYDGDLNLLGDGVTDTRFVVNGLFTPDANKAIAFGDSGGGPRRLRQFNLDGALDETFATGGSFQDVDNLFGSGFITPSLPMVFDSAGRLLVYSPGVGLIRFLSTGSLDANFGTAGVAGTSESGSGVDIAQAGDGAYYVMLNDGRILRYTAAGALDSGFGTDGVLTSGTGVTRVSGIAAMPDNGVVTVVNNDQGTSARLVHFSATGAVVNESSTLSESFQLGDGTNAIQLGYGGGASLLGLEDGRVLLSINWVGRTPAWQILGYQLFGLFNADLTPDTDFDGGNGLIVHESFASFSSQLPVTRRLLTRDNQGRILFVSDFGSNGNSGITDGMATWGVARLMGSSDGEGGGGDPDTTPDAFSFTTVTDVALETLVTSSPVTITGLGAPATISVSNGEYAIGCGASFTSASGSIANNQTVCVRHTSAATHDTDTNTTLTIGGVSAQFISTTLADAGGGPDTTPDAFSFTTQTDVLLSTQVTSNAVTITGIDAAAAISVSNGSYSVGCDGGFTTAPGTIENNEAVCVRHTSAATCLANVTTVLTVGGVQGSFTSTTIDDSVDSDGDGVSDCLDSDPYDAGSASPALPGGNTLDMTVDDGSFSGVEILDADNLGNQTGRPDSMSFPYGLASYEVTGLTPGASVEVVLTYPATLPAGTRVFKYSDADGFAEFSGAVISGNTVTLTLVDGGAGDADGVANGTIVDPVGVAAPAQSSPEQPSQQGKSGGGSLSPAWLILLGVMGWLARRRA